MTGVQTCALPIYTTAEAALKIITQKRLWLRNAACMADYREMHHGFSILQWFFLDEGKRKSFEDAVDGLALGAARDAISFFDEWWRAGAIPFKTFIASTSEHDPDEDLYGRLSMWRAFGGNSARVGMVLNIPLDVKGAEDLNLFFSPVAYFKKVEAEQWVPEVIKNISANADYLKTIGQDKMKQWLFLMLLLGVTCVKHIGFREEKEWRAVYCPQLYPSQIIKPTTQIVNGVPQSVYELPLDKNVDSQLENLDFARLFDRLIIGPSPYPLAMSDAFFRALSDAGVAEVEQKIFILDIPIRSM